MKSRRALPALLVLAVGCGGGGNDAPKPISGPPKEVADVVARLQKATAQHDFSTICDDLFAAAARKQAGGDDCARLLGERAGDVRRPRIVIQAINVDGNQARAQVRTTAGGQAPTTDVIRLVREGGQFRIVSLGG